MARMSDEDLDKQIQQYEKICRKPVHLQKKEDRGTLDRLYMERMYRRGEPTTEEEAEINDLLGDNVENFIRANYKPRETVTALVEDGFDRRLVIQVLNRIRGQYRRRAFRRLLIHVILFLLATGGLIYCLHQVPPASMKTFADYLRFSWWKAAVSTADDRYLTWLKISPIIVVIITFFGGLNALGDLMKVVKDYREGSGDRR